MFGVLTIIQINRVNEYENEIFELNKKINYYKNESNLIYNNKQKMIRELQGDVEHLLKENEKVNKMFNTYREAMKEINREIRKKG